jgi:hypothetical protein
MANTRISGNSLVVNSTGVDSSIPPGSISATGTITGGNFSTVGTVTSATLLANVLTAVTVITTANVQSGNLRTTGVVNATGNIIGGNLITVGSVTSQNTIYAPSANITGLLTTGTLSVGSLLLSNVSTAGNVTGGNLRTTGTISATGAIISAAGIQAQTIRTLTQSGSIVGGDISAYGNVVIDGNLTVNNKIFVTSSTPRQIWVSSLAPQASQGSVGDIWYQY